MYKLCINFKLSDKIFFGNPKSPRLVQNLPLKRPRGSLVRTYPATFLSVARCGWLATYHSHARGQMWPVGHIVTTL